MFGLEYIYKPQRSEKARREAQRRRDGAWAWSPKQSPTKEQRRAWRKSK